MKRTVEGFRHTSVPMIENSEYFIVRDETRSSDRQVTTFAPSRPLTTCKSQRRLDALSRNASLRSPFKLYISEKSYPGQNFG